MTYAQAWIVRMRTSLSHPSLQTRELKCYRKTGSSVRRDEVVPQQNQPITPAPATAATAAPVPSTEIATKHASTSARKPSSSSVREIKMKGVEISDCDTLVVEGRVEATLDSRVLEITENGVFQGTIAVDNAEMHGRFEGELTVRKQLIIHATGRCRARSATPRSRSRKARSSPATCRCSTRIATRSP